MGHQDLGGRLVLEHRDAVLGHAEYHLHALDLDHRHRRLRAEAVAAEALEQQVEAEKDAVEQVRAAGKESEAIGTLGQSRPSVKTMFEEVYATEDWRLVEQRREVGV